MPQKRESPHVAIHLCSRSTTNRHCDFVELANLIRCLLNISDTVCNRAAQRLGAPALNAAVSIDAFHHKATPKSLKKGLFGYLAPPCVGQYALLKVVGKMEREEQMIRKRRGKRGSESQTQEFSLGSWETSFLVGGLTAIFRQGCNICPIGRPVRCLRLTVFSSRTFINV